MNRIEAAMQKLKQEQKKAFITYITAGLPDLNGTKEIIRAQERGGCDVVELGIPFSDPAADGPVIQNASYRAICGGTNLRKIFKMMEELRSGGTETPVVFMMYYNTVLHYGVERFVKKCGEAGVDGLIIPDLPFEEQGELMSCLGETDQTILIQLVSPVSEKRLPMILENARGFVYCVSSMGVTGQNAEFHKEIKSYLNKVKQAAEIPVMMGFGIRLPEDVIPLKEVIDGAIVGTHFIELMEQSGFCPAEAERYCREFKEALNVAEQDGADGNNLYQVRKNAQNKENSDGK